MIEKLKNLFEKFILSLLLTCIIIISVIIILSFVFWSTKPFELFFSLNIKETFFIIRLVLISSLILTLIKKIFIEQENEK